MREDIDLLSLLAQCLEGRAVAGINGEGGEEVTPRNNMGAALERRSTLRELGCHLLLDRCLEDSRRGAASRVVGVDGERHPARFECLAKPADLLERLGALVVRRGERLAGRWRALGLGLSLGLSLGLRLSLGHHRCGGAPSGGERQGEHEPEPPHRRSSSWKSVRFFANSSSDMSA
jgi:hypothetical protein